MAAELQIDYFTGKTVYYLVRNSIGKIWNGASFESYLTADYASYAIAATEQGVASGFYAASMPGTTAGVYSVVAKVQAGGSPAETDTTIGSGSIEWDGTVTTTGIGAFINTVAHVEGVADINSLATACLKLVSKFDAKTGITYKTDGVTAKMTQLPVTDPTMVPIRSLPVGV